MNSVVTFLLVVLTTSPQTYSRTEAIEIQNNFNDETPTLDAFGNYLIEEIPDNGELSSVYGSGVITVGEQESSGEVEQESENEDYSSGDEFNNGNAVITDNNLEGSTEIDGGYSGEDEDDFSSGEEIQENIKDGFPITIDEDQEDNSEISEDFDANDEDDNEGIENNVDDENELDEDNSIYLAGSNESDLNDEFSEDNLDYNLQMEDDISEDPNSEEVINSFPPVLNNEIIEELETENDYFSGMENETLNGTELQPAYKNASMPWIIAVTCLGSVMFVLLIVLIIAIRNRINSTEISTEKPSNVPYSVMESGYDVQYR